MSEIDPDDLLQILTHLETLHRSGLKSFPLGDLAALSKLASLETELANKPVAEQTAAPSPSHAQPTQVEDHIAVEPPDKENSLFANISRPRPKPFAKTNDTRPPVKMVAAMFDQSRKPIESPLIPPSDRPALLSILADEVAACTRCAHLAATRTQTVFQSGTPSARLMFIGEAPGADEDRAGEPFVGRAGQLVTDIIKAMGLDRSQVYIANVLKCRPPENRTPTNDEIANCLHFLERQIEIVRPEFICLLGKTAAMAVLQSALPMKNLRLKWFRYRDIPTIVTYHPAYLLRNPPAKKDTWEDIKMLMAEMGLKPPPKAKP